MHEGGVEPHRASAVVASRVESVQDMATQHLSIADQVSESRSAQAGIQEQLRLENENLRLEVQRLRRNSAGPSDVPPSYSDPVAN